MTQMLKSLSRVVAAAVLASAVGCGAAEEADTVEASAPVGAISQQLGVAYTITAWPSVFPVVAGAPSVIALIPVSSGSNIQFNIAVSTDGNVTITGFKYGTYSALTPNQNFVKNSNRVVKNFALNSPLNYSINVSAEWIGSTIELSIASPVVPGGSIKSATTTLIAGS